MSVPHFIFTVDSATARLFNREGQSPRGLPVLTEVSTVTRPEARLTGSQRFSDSTPVGGGGGGYHTLDDHRQEHDVEERRRFAQEIAQTLADRVQAPTDVVVCVTHAMQALLADAMNRHCRHVHATWQTAEYTRLTAHELSNVLTKKLAKSKAENGSLGG